MPISNFAPPCDVLLGHVLECNRAVVHVSLAAGCLREVNRTCHGVGAVDWRKQGQIAAGIAHLSAAERDGKGVMVPPDAVVEHISEEYVLLPAGSAGGADSAAVLSARVSGEGKGHL